MSFKKLGKYITGKSRAKNLIKSLQSDSDFHDKAAGSSLRNVGNRTWADNEKDAWEYEHGGNSPKVSNKVYKDQDAIMNRNAEKHVAKRDYYNKKISKVNRLMQKEAVGDYSGPRNKALDAALDKISQHFSPENQKKRDDESKAKREADPSYQAWKKRSDAHAPARAAAKEQFEKNLADIRAQKSALHKQIREKLTAKRKK